MWKTSTLLRTLGSGVSDVSLVLPRNLGKRGSICLATLPTAQERALQIESARGAGPQTEATKDNDFHVHLPTLPAKGKSGLLYEIPSP